MLLQQIDAEGIFVLEDIELSVGFAGLDDLSMLCIAAARLWIKTVNTA